MYLYLYLSIYLSIYIYIYNIYIYIYIYTYTYTYMYILYIYALYSLSLPTFYLNLIQTHRAHLDLTGHVENVNIFYQKLSQNHGKQGNMQCSPHTRRIIFVNGFYQFEVTLNTCTSCHQKNH